MMLSNNMNILTPSKAHTRLRNETLGLFEFLPPHPSPFSMLGSLMCIDCINKNLVCKLSKLLQCQPLLKGPPQKVKSQKKFQKPRKNKSHARSPPASLTEGRSRGGSRKGEVHPQEKTPRGNRALQSIRGLRPEPKSRHISFQNEAQCFNSRND